MILEQGMLSSTLSRGIETMPLEPPDQKFFEAACGYAQLGMFLDANAELEKVDPYKRAAPEILALRVAIYKGLERWELMQVVAQRLVEFDVRNIDFVISYAFATRRAESIEAAKQILLNAEPKFPNQAVIKYNLACYFCQLEDLESAKDYLKRAFEIDPNWRLQALEDEDLQPLWDSLQATIE
jgi:tetratricopeptide (TPR) repeat protein